MKIHELKRKQEMKNTLRVGRGISAGGGKTAGRGTKGQKSRSGHNIPKKFEGGQTPLNMRLHKLPGFKSHRSKNKIITLKQISDNFSDGETVSRDSLIKKGLINQNDFYKVLSNGKLTKKVIFSDIKKSQSVKTIETPNKTKTEK